MIKAKTKPSWASRVTAACVTAMLTCAGSYAQNRDSEFYTDFNPAGVAEAYLFNTDLVAIGQFGTPVEVGFDSLSLLESREIDLPFTVLTVYKGNISPGDVVLVRLRNDMLAYPGETVSRYEKRIQLLDERRQELRAATAETTEVQRELDAGSITPEEAQRRFREIDIQNGRLISETREWRRIQRRPVSSHGATIEKRGGAIRPNTPYLLAVESIDGNFSYYSLREFNSPIWWGEAADAIRSEIEILKENAPGFR